MPMRDHAVGRLLRDGPDQTNQSPPAMARKPRARAKAREM
jgi:hypothetical protein